MIRLLAWGAAGFASAGGLSVCVLAVRRLLLARSERRRKASESLLLPVALRFLDDEDGGVEHLSEEDAQALAPVLLRLGRNLRGVSRERIATFFERHRLVDQPIRQLASSRPWKRAAAAFSLGDMGSHSAIAALSKALDDADRDVRSAAARSLGLLGATDAVPRVVYAVVTRQIPRSVGGQALLAIGSAALPGLRELETATDAETRAFAVELVGLLGDASDDEHLLGRLRDTSAEVRAKAARALGRLGAEEGAAELIAALDDRIVFVRAAAAHALAAVGDPAAVPKLIRVARDDQFDAARAAAQAAARIDPVAVRDAAADTSAGIHLQEASDRLPVIG